MDSKEQLTMRKNKSKRRKFSWGGSNKNMRGYIQQPQSTV
jgi:hypothetical protein